ncbi:NAD(P)-binding protein [Lepidopterella palustris CBS 459.81]|uniref:NAD(P)-binding protein n=1 Tax=Lepidopterella palustris CBS 459.81 TaxID=1314670 RepID=A0A8E2EJM4_9PEZI|nr:NAD(P)-binding protein [Lepidopterella palustris CBS 459.81]
MPNVLIVGATRGLGAELAKYYASKGNNVFATARTSNPPSNAKNLTYIPSIDISSENAGHLILQFLAYHSIKTLAIVVITAGYFATETLSSPSFASQEKMYKTCAIGPTILVTALANSPSLLPKSSKIILVSSESGSITLRHESEGGGNYGHHASKSALNMCGKLLSLDLKERGVAVGLVHPSFMRTDMTKGVGFDKFWDHGGAVTPNVAAESLADWVETFGMDKTGQFWAPRGAADIGTAGQVLGPREKLSTPLLLPW